MRYFTHSNIILNNYCVILTKGGMETPNPMSVNTVERIRYDQKHQKTRVTLFPGLPVAVTGTACCVTK